MRCLLTVATALALAACGPVVQRLSQEPIDRTGDVSLWEEPAALTGRDLIGGVGGRALTPLQRDVSFAFVSRKTSGKNPGYVVRDRSGREWSVKLGIEA